jgi:hypothetical protein
MGSRITSLLKIDARAIFHTMGNSRRASKPCTYFGVTAASSITAPAAFIPALVACATTSSTEAAATLAMAATSSSSASNPLMISSPFDLHRPWPARPGGGNPHARAETVARSKPSLFSGSADDNARC